MKTTKHKRWAEISDKLRSLAFNRSFKVASRYEAAKHRIVAHRLGFNIRQRQQAKYVIVTKIR